MGLRYSESHVGDIVLFEDRKLEINLRTRFDCFSCFFERRSLCLQIACSAIERNDNTCVIYNEVPV